MPPLVNADRVKETSTTTGTGTYDLAGAVAGFQTFVAGIGGGNECDYVAEDGTDWEIGVGVVTDATPDTLTRPVIVASSNGGAAVNWGAGTRNIFCSAIVAALEAERVLEADQASTTVTTNVDVTGLNFPVKNGRRYWFDYRTLYRAAATTTGIRLSVTVPAFTKFAAIVDTPTSTSADTTTGIFRGHITTSGDQVVGTGTPATATDYIATVSGLLVPSADGVIQLVYASEVSGSAVTVAQGSGGRCKWLR